MLQFTSLKDDAEFESEKLRKRESDMAEKKTIYFRLFGSFAYRQSKKEKWQQLDGSASCGRKLRSFIEYLIVNHDSDISADDLREKFWPLDKSSNPASSLKYTMHKARAVLSQMFPEYADDLVWTVRGYFIWNPEVSIKVDIEEFEKKCRLIRKRHKEQTAEDYMSVLKLYTGEILPGSNMEWMQSLRLHYRTLYTDMCRSAVEKLREEGRWKDIAEISEHAYSLEPDVEDFTVFYMQALTELGQPERTIEHYDIYKKQIWKKLRQVPSETVEHELSLAVKKAASRSSGGNDLIEMLTSRRKEQNAFLCSFNVFKNVLDLEKRHIARDKHKSSIVILTLTDIKESINEAAELRRLEKTILENLRAGDPVARINDGSFAALLSGSDEAGAAIAVERIRDAFGEKYQNSESNIVDHIYAMTCEN